MKRSLLLITAMAVCLPLVLIAGPGKGKGTPPAKPLSPCGPCPMSDKPAMAPDRPGMPPCGMMPCGMMPSEAQPDPRVRDLRVQERANEVQFDQEMKKLDLEARKLDLQKKRTELQRQPAGGKSGWKQGHCGRRGMILCALAHLAMAGMIALVHILLAVWVYTDIRKRSSGSGLWIIITLLIGFFGVVPYAIVRLGDIKATEQR